MANRISASNDHRVQQVRNPEGIWINTQYFREEANKFLKTGTYCPDPIRSPSWMEYWTEQLKRCKEGYSFGGVRITGHHYFYLNFCPIMRVAPGEDPNSKKAKKIRTFADFWDGDYNFFWAIEIAENGMTVDAYRALQLHVRIDPEFLEGGLHFIVGKARRKGYSYKNAAICANVYNTNRNSLTIIGAFDKKYLYPEGTMGMASSYLDFLNQYTAWGKAREYVDKQEHKKASFKKTLNGITSEAGYRSQIMALTFADNPDAARGKDARYVLFEEAGKFPNLKDSYEATRPGLTAGTFITGQMIIFGTGGDMESGTVDFANMFYNPKEYDLMPFVNIWDDNAENTSCGFFHPTTWNMEGAYDTETGNSDIPKALALETKTREKLVKNASSVASLQKRVQEYPLCPAEAFLTVSMNDFPVADIRKQKDKVEREKLHIIKGQPVDLQRNEQGKIVAIPDLKKELDPIWRYRYTNTNLAGAVVIYEFPSSNAPKNAYKIGYDPYRQDQGTSLASIYVYKPIIKGEETKNRLVAQYVGRLYSADSVNRISEMLAELYNTQVMYENEVTHTRDYFMRKKKLNLLALQPDTVISTNISNSKVSRVYGCHMTEKLKDAGEKYIKEWLLEVVDIDEYGNEIRNIDFIYDIGLLEELIDYDRKKGNFDRVMALMMVMFQLKEEELQVYETGDINDSIAEQFQQLLLSQYKKNVVSNNF